MAILLRGGAGRKTVLLIFQPTQFIVHIMISMKKYGEKKTSFFLPLIFHGNGGHL